MLSRWRIWVLVLGVASGVVDGCARPRRTGGPPRALAASDAAVHYHAGLAYAGASRFEDAAHEYREALRLDPTLGAARLNLGMAYKALGYPADAVIEFQEVMRSDPTLAAAAALDVGGVYEDLGRPADAVAAFRRAVRLEPGSGAAHYALGRALLLVGDRAGAEDEQRALRTLDPVWAERLERLLAP